MTKIADAFRGTEQKPSRYVFIYIYIWFDTIRVLCRDWRTVVQNHGDASRLSFGSVRNGSVRLTVLKFKGTDFGCGTAEFDCDTELFRLTVRSLVYGTERLQNEINSVNDTEFG